MGSIMQNFENLKKSSIERGSRKSKNWLKNKISGKGIDKEYIVSPQEAEIGHMYLFVYDPKWKAELPYWDRNPLILVINYYRDGFLGLNLHYLQPKTRAVLLDKLMEFSVGNDEDKRLRLTWNLLKGASRYREVRPTVKRYLYTHLSSRMAVIPGDEWERAILLPVARFYGASNQEVYRESKKIYQSRVP